MTKLTEKKKLEKSARSTVADNLVKNGQKVVGEAECSAQDSVSLAARYCWLSSARKFSVGRRVIDADFFVQDIILRWKNTIYELDNFDPEQATCC